MTDETDRDTLTTAGYRVIDARNQHVVSGYMVKLPEDPSWMLIAATEDEAWELASRHRLAHSLPSQADAGDERLRAHFTRMMEAVANYLEPTDYIARHPDTGNLGACKWNTEFPEPNDHQSESGKAETKARRDQAFIRDMIYMLDGPEQRAVLATLTAPPASDAGEEEPCERWSEIADDPKAIVRCGDRWKAIAANIGCELHGFNDGMAASFVTPDGHVIEVGPKFRVRLAALSPPTSGEEMRLRERLTTSPMIEALTPTNDEWVACETVQDTYDLMKRRIGRAFTLPQGAGQGGNR